MNVELKEATRKNVCVWLCVTRALAEQPAAYELEACFDINSVLLILLTCCLL